MKQLQMVVQTKLFFVILASLIDRKIILILVFKMLLIDKFYKLVKYMKIKRVKYF